jgi:hypothetical protein
VYFAEHITSSKTPDGIVYEYDHYRLELMPRKGLMESIEKNIPAWLVKARATENVVVAPDPIEDRLAVIEAENTALKERLAKIESTDTVKTELVKLEPIIKDPIIKDPILTR